MLNSTSRKLNFLFTSDEHGYITRQAQLQSEVDRTRQANPEGTLLISCGDIFEGSAENGVLGPEASLRMLKTAGYDLVTIGNHDFDRGAAEAREWIANLPSDVLVSNLKDSATGDLLENTAASRIYELNGVKLGLIGVTTPETVAILPKSKLEGLSIEDPTPAVRAEVDKLKAQGVELIGVVSHLGLPGDRQLALDVPELNFILGGHTHNATDEPERIGQTLIAHPGAFRKQMGNLELEVDPHTSQVVGVNYNLISGDDSRACNGEVGRLAKDLQTKVEAVMGETVSTLPEAIDYDPDSLGEGMEWLLGEAVRSKTPAEAVLINQKNPRAGLEAGDVKVGDVYNAFPFDNRVVTLDMTAQDVLRLHAESIRRNDQSSFAVTGEQFTVACDVPERQLIMVSNLPKDKVVEDLEPLPLWGPKVASMNYKIPEDRVVKVASLDYLTAGGLDYFPPGTPVEAEHGTVREVVQDHLSTHYPPASQTGQDPG